MPFGAHMSAQHAYVRRTCRRSSSGLRRRTRLPPPPEPYLSGAPHQREVPMSVQDEIKRIDRAGYPRAQGRQADRVAHLLSRAHRAPGRPALRLHPGRQLARHGDARPGIDRAGHARHDDPAGAGGDARLEARAGRRRHAVRLVRGLARAGVYQRRAGHEGDRLRRDQARRRRAHGGDDRVPQPSAAFR